MGTIIPRRRADGSTAYLAQILKKKDGRIVHREARTFDRKVVAKAWIEKREADIAAPGGLERTQTPKGTLGDAIDKYIAMSRKEIGRTKTQVLRSIKTYSIADMDCADIKSTDIIAFAEELSAGRKPQTVGNYVSHLSAIFRLARPAWRLPLDYQAAPHSTPMHLIVPFALFSTRRQEEITRISWVDLDEEHARVLVRDMKNPGQKIGNDVWVDLPPEALSIVKAMPRTDARIFPYTTDAIGAAFTRACLILGITTDRMPDEKRLHFHDLRHEEIFAPF